MAKLQTGDTYDDSTAEEIRSAIDDAEVRLRLAELTETVIDCQVKLLIWESHDSD